MARKLPKNEFPIHVFVIPSTKEKKRFRPFLVKEAKALMSAEGFEDKTIMFETLKQIIQNCCLDEIDVDSLAVFDCEYILIKLRSISVFEDIFVYMECDGDHNSDRDFRNSVRHFEGGERPPHIGGPHGQERSPLVEDFHKDELDGSRHDKSKEHKVASDRKFEVKVNLDTVEVANLDTSNTHIKLSDDKLVVMQYPDLEVLNVIFNPRREASWIEVVASCINKLVIKEEVYTKDEMDIADLFDWVETLDKASFEKLLAFFYNLPYTRVKVEWDCPVCGKHNIRYLVGLDAFFE